MTPIQSVVADMTPIQPEAIQLSETAVSAWKNLVEDHSALFRPGDEIREEMMFLSDEGELVVMGGAGDIEFMMIVPPCHWRPALKA